MATINELNAASSAEDGDLLAIWKTANGDTRKIPVSALLARTAAAPAPAPPPPPAAGGRVFTTGAVRGAITDAFYPLGLLIADHTIDAVSVQTTGEGTLTAQLVVGPDNVGPPLAVDATPVRVAITPAVAVAAAATPKLIGLQVSSASAAVDLYYAISSTVAS